MFAHLSNTYPWRLSELAKQALRPGGHLSGAVHSELTRLIDYAEKAFNERNVLRDPWPAPEPASEIRPRSGGLGRLPRLLLR